MIAPAKVLIVGNLCSGKTTFRTALATSLGWRHAGIDDARRTLGDGSPAGEARAWAEFLMHAQTPEVRVLECTGAGPWVSLLQLALRESELRLALIHVQTRLAVCLARLAAHTALVPYPRFGLPPAKVILSVEAELASRLVTFWPPPLLVVSGESATAPAVAAALERLGSART